MIVCESDGRGNAAWARVAFTAALVADREAWRTVLVEQLEDAIEAVKARGA